MGISIYNASSLDNNLLIEVATFVAPKQSEMPEEYFIHYSDEWFDYDENGEKIYNPDIPWDGTAYWPNIAVVILTPEAKETHFPMVWWPNPELPGNYIRGTYLRDYIEFLVYVTAHECRHLWQYQNPKKHRLYRGFGGDEETDADLFGILKLNEWRKLHQ